MKELKMPVKKVTSKRRSGLSVPVYSLAGRVSGKMVLPKEIFGAEVKKSLLDQALGVYMVNQKLHTASTKTRGEVRGSTAKIWRQKGTGRARHGARKAPIFVGGGITFGPKPKNIRLGLPKKMKRAALVAALSSKTMDNKVFGLSGLEKASGKTSELANLLEKLKVKNALFVTPEKSGNVVRGVRNIPKTDVLPANQINAFEILKHQNLLITKEALEALRPASPRGEQAQGKPK